MNCALCGAPACEFDKTPWRGDQSSQYASWVVINSRWLGKVSILKRNPATGKCVETTTIFKGDLANERRTLLIEKVTHTIDNNYEMDDASKASYAHLFPTGSISVYDAECDGNIFSMPIHKSCYGLLFTLGLRRLKLSVVHRVIYDALKSHYSCIDLKNGIPKDKQDVDPIITEFITEMEMLIFDTISAEDFCVTSVDVDAQFGAMRMTFLHREKKRNRWIGPRSSAIEYFNFTKAEYITEKTGLDEKPILETRESKVIAGFFGHWSNRDSHEANLTSFGVFTHDNQSLVSYMKPRDIGRQGFPWCPTGTIRKPSLKEQSPIYGQTTLIKRHLYPNEPVPSFFARVAWLDCSKPIQTVQVVMCHSMTSRLLPMVSMALFYDDKKQKPSTCGSRFILKPDTGGVNGHPWCHCAYGNAKFEEHSAKPHYTTGFWEVGNSRLETLRLWIDEAGVLTGLQFDAENEKESPKWEFCDADTPIEIELKHQSKTGPALQVFLDSNGRNDKGEDFVIAAVQVLSVAVKPSKGTVDWLADVKFLTWDPEKERSMFLPVDKHDDARRFLLKNSHKYPHTTGTGDNSVEAYNPANGKPSIIALHSSCYRILGKTTSPSYLSPDALYMELKPHCTREHGFVRGLDYNYRSVTKLQCGGSWWTKKGSEYVVMDPWPRDAAINLALTLAEQAMEAKPEGYALSHNLALKASFREDMPWYVRLIPEHLWFKANLKRVHWQTLYSMFQQLNKGQHPGNALTANTMFNRRRIWRLCHRILKDTAPYYNRRVLKWEVDLAGSVMAEGRLAARTIHRSQNFRTRGCEVVEYSTSDVYSTHKGGTETAWLASRITGLKFAFTDGRTTQTGRCHPFEPEVFRPPVGHFIAGICAQWKPGKLIKSIQFRCLPISKAPTGCFERLLRQDVKYTSSSVGPLLSYRRDLELFHTVKTVESCWGRRQDQLSNTDIQGQRLVLGRCLADMDKIISFGVDISIGSFEVVFWEGERGGKRQSLTIGPRKTVMMSLDFKKPAHRGDWITHCYATGLGQAVNALGFRFATRKGRQLVVGTPGKVEVRFPPEENSAEDSLLSEICCDWTDAHPHKAELWTFKTESAMSPYLSPCIEGQVCRSAIYVKANGKAFDGTAVDGRLRELTI
ncbi:hypothetical protein FGRMN_3490 [Fusarium graminum]|nr:hypothetical protein FGRMN_3490 [Fusarium graminum]